MIPAHALELKENLSGIDAGGSRTKDNEDTTASLGHSEILGIQDSPRGCALWSIDTASTAPSELVHTDPDPLSATDEASDEASKGAVVARKNAGNIFPNDIWSPCLVREIDESEREIPALVGETAAIAGDAE